MSWVPYFDLWTVRCIVVDPFAMIVDELGQFETVGMEAKASEMETLM